MKQHWSEYWKQGHLTSFGADFNGNYAGILRNVWLPILDGLKPGFEVLDVATGNGAIPLLIGEYLGPSNINGRVRGIDYAEIQTATIEKNYQIEIDLIGGVNCESIPFEEQVDLVTSQFGIEYSNLTESLIQISNILKNGGRISLVCHHSDSVIIVRNKRILAIVQNSLVGELIDNLFSLVEAMGDILNKSDLQRLQEDTVCERLRMKINHLIGELVAIDQSALQDAEILNYVMTFFKKGMFWSVKDKKNYLKFVQQQINDLGLRLAELINAALDVPKLADMLTLLSSVGVKLSSISTLKTDDNQIIAWHLVFDKQVN
ncbi:class I SAM-dependent methyltransferase [Shewanella sp. HN-41]|uniref:class I SAM-dependent methyltransferase n=1 Tax=Shewanella sp. HN-41 TaxID=327275 RepID=UPI0002126026|nr:class I SAM-dependent methyltransferase [Shewanella sp. HN-41]EGM70361.1 methyltransferase type 11 [Shewanella sp. HN-41]